MTTFCCRQLNRSQRLRSPAIWRSIPVLNGWKTFFIPLSFILSDVPVFDDGKTLYQKALRVVVTPDDVPQTAGGDKRPFGNAARTDDVLPTIGPHLVRIAVKVPPDAVHRQGLRDIPRYHPVEVAFLLQVPVIANGAFIREVKGTLHIAFNGAFVGGQGKEQFVKTPDMLPRLYRAVLLRILREGQHQRFPTVQYIDFLSLRFRKVVCLSGGENRYQCANSQEYHSEQPQLPERCLDVF